MTRWKVKSHNKYNAVRTKAFDSKAEGAYLKLVRLFESSGLISNVRWKPNFRLIVNGIDIGKYTPEVSFTESSSSYCDDVKGYIKKAEAASLRTRIASACNPDILFRWVSKSGRIMRVWRAGKLIQRNISNPRRKSLNKKGTNAGTTTT